MWRRGSRPGPGAWRRAFCDSISILFKEDDAGLRTHDEGREGEVEDANRVSKDGGNMRSSVDLAAMIYFEEHTTQSAGLS